MLSPLSLDPRHSQMIRDLEHEPTLDEQALHRLVREAHHTPWYNTLVMWVLRSPLHFLLSGSVMLVTVLGRKSGHSITTPVNYVHGRGSALYTLSKRDHVWWHNLVGGAPLTVHLCGQDYLAGGSVIVEPQAVTVELENLLHRIPKCAAPLHIHWTQEGELNPADVARTAQAYVLISLELN